jgi:hypothetical protein
MGSGFCMSPWSIFGEFSSLDCAYGVMLSYRERRVSFVIGQYYCNKVLFLDIGYFDLL